MTASKLIKNHNVTIAVTANAEVMFPPGGLVYGWTRRLSNAVERGTKVAAPGHNYAKRPLRPHPGKPLKTTFKAAPPRFRNLPSGPRLYVAVGSSAPYAAYVDQGTGIYGGNGPYEAKILPPWAPLSPSLYEHTWHPPNQRSKTRVMIKGQRGQHFFDEGLQRGFQQMRMRSYQRPGLDPAMGDILRTWPRELENFMGNTPGGDAMFPRLAVWRSWRQEHFDSGRIMGKDGGGATREADRRAMRSAVLRQRRLDRTAGKRLRRAQLSKERSQARRDRIKAEKGKSTQKPKQRKPVLNAGQKANAAAKLEAQKFFNNPKHAGFAVVGGIQPWGFTYRDRGGTLHQHIWSTTVADLFIDAGVRYTKPPRLIN